MIWLVLSPIPNPHHQKTWRVRASVFALWFVAVKEPRNSATHSNGRRSFGARNHQVEKKPSHRQKVLARLLPCPFCGAEPAYEIKRHFWETAPMFEIWCYCLRASVIERSETAAIEKWNQRNLKLISLSRNLKAAVVQNWKLRRDHLKCKTNVSGRTK